MVNPPFEKKKQEVVLYPPIEPRNKVGAPDPVYKRCEIYNPCKWPKINGFAWGYNPIFSN